MAGTSDPGPLSAADLDILASTRKRARKVYRAAAVAAFSGWTMAVFAGLTLIAVVFGDLVALVLGVLLSVLAWNEIRGGTRLRQLDPRAAATLGYNQIALGVLIVAYAAWSLWASLHDPSLATLTTATGDPSTDALMKDLTKAVTYGLYGGIAIAGIIGPGLTSWYYFSRRRIVCGLIQESPAWAIQAIRAAA